MSIIDTLTKASGMDVFLREISDTNTYKPVAFSVQVRITDSKMGILLPEVFMPVAEKTAKAKQILLWSVKKCMTMMQNLTKRDIPFDFFALYCPETFICDVVAVEEFLSLVSDKNMLNLFAFYISPSLLISQNSTVNDNIVLLRSLGVRFIVLNFGCEGFPLSKVLKATFDMVVLDDFMVECLCGEEQEKNYATSIIDMAKKLGLTVIADNVKTPSTLQNVATLCPLAIGDFFGKYKKDRYVRRK